MPSWIKRTVGISLTMLVLLLGAALVAPWLIDQEQLLSDLEAEISLSLGRPTQIESIGLLQLLPTPRLRLDAVQVAESVAADAPTLAAADSLRLDAAMVPLLSGRLVLAEVLIERPMIRLPVASSAATASAPSAHTTRIAERYRSVLAVSEPQSSALGAESAFKATAAAPGQPNAANGERVSEAEPAAPTLPPIHRLVIREGTLVGPSSPAGSSSAFGLSALSLTAGPIAAGQNGRLDATFRLDVLGTQTPGAATSLPGLAEAEIRLADPLTEIVLRPLRLRFGGSAGGQGPPIDVEAAAMIDLMTGRVSIDPFELIAHQLRATGAAELFSTAAGLGVDAQVRVSPLDLRTWLSEQVGFSMPGAEDSLRRLGGQFDLQLRGPLVAIDNAALLLDQTRASALARLRLPQAPSVPTSGRLAVALDQLDLDRYLPGAATVGARALPSRSASMMLPPLPPLPPEAGATEQGLRLQLAAGELRLGGLGFRSVSLGGGFLPDSLELDADADFYGGWLQTQFAATQPGSIVGEQQGQSDPPSDPGSASAPTNDPASGPDLQLDAIAGSVDLAALLADLPFSPGAQAPISGLAEIDLSLFARGAEPALIIPSLGGEASLSVRDGAVTMVDLGQLIIGTIGAIGVSPEDAESLTRFRAFSLSAKGAEGRFSSDDIQLRSNLLNIDGGGRLDLTTEQIALDLQAVMTKPPKGRGIKELEGIPIPISATGPWADPRWEVDVKAALDAAARRALHEDSGLLDEIEERTGIRGLGDGLRQILPGLLGQ